MQSTACAFKVARASISSVLLILDNIYKSGSETNKLVLVGTMATP